MQNVDVPAELGMRPADQWSVATSLRSETKMEPVAKVGGLGRYRYHRNPWAVLQVVGWACPKIIENGAVWTHFVAIS